MTDFGSWLSDRREKRGLSKLSLGKKAGISDAIISYWESGVRNPRRDNIEPVARALATDDQDEESIRALVDEALVAAGFAPEYQRTDPERSAISGLYEGLSPGGKRRAVDMLKLLRDAEQDAAIGGTGEPKTRPGDDATDD